MVKVPTNSDLTGTEGQGTDMTPDEAYARYLRVWGQYADLERLLGGRS